jgi:hypothetical protein
MTQADTIATLNDQFRETFDHSKVFMTPGIAALENHQRVAVFEAVKTGEHDFGAFEAAGHQCFFKIDYYDISMEYGSEDPSDPLRTARVLTIMLSNEY